MSSIVMWRQRGEGDFSSLPVTCRALRPQDAFERLETCTRASKAVRHSTGHGGLGEGERRGSDPLKIELNVPETAVHMAG